MKHATTNTHRANSALVIPGFAVLGASIVAMFTLALANPGDWLSPGERVSVSDQVALSQPGPARVDAATIETSPATETSSIALVETQQIENAAPSVEAEDIAPAPSGKTQEPEDASISVAEATEPAAAKPAVPEAPVPATGAAEEAAEGVTAATETPMRVASLPAEPADPMTKQRNRQEYAEELAGEPADDYSLADAATDMLAPEVAEASLGQELDPTVAAMAALAPAAGDPQADLRERTLAGAATESVAALSAHFEKVKYSLAEVRDEGNAVPRLYVASVPPDLAEIVSVGQRKRLFIKMVLPLILRVNEDILGERARILLLRERAEQGLDITDGERTWLGEIAARYSTSPDNWDALLRRVDIIPPSLAIAQAAEESGWGTSRFAREGNALFGQYTYNPALGIRPEGLEDGQRQLIRAYENLYETVRSYMRNLNLHAAYGDFREARARMRTGEANPNGFALAGELNRYSERGEDYVRSIRLIIRANMLDKFDGARLHDPGWSHEAGLPNNQTS